MIWSLPPALAMFTNSYLGSTVRSCLVNIHADIMDVPACSHLTIANHLRPRHKENTHLIQSVGYDKHSSDQCEREMCSSLGHFRSANFKKNEHSWGYLRILQNKIVELELCKWFQVGRNSPGAPNAPWKFMKILETWLITLISHTLLICAPLPASFAVPALRNPCSWRRRAAAPQGPSGARHCKCEVQLLEKMGRWMSL